MTYDYIIVGSGSSGGMIAFRLSENPDVRVLLLEAGPTDKHWSTTMPAGARYTFNGGPRNWCFDTQPEPFMNNRVIFQPRGKTLGGSSSLNGMVFVRGHPLDFEHWNSVAPGWDYSSVKPFYKKMERYQSSGHDARGQSGPIGVQKLTDNHPIESAFLRAGVQAGYPQPDDYNSGRAQEGVTQFDANIDRGWRSGTARECVRPAMTRSNCTVLTGAHVTSIVIETNRAVGVEFQRKGQSFTARAESEVILSAGAFQSPQLLMLSGIGPAGELKKHGIGIVQDMPGVGENLQDHLEVHIKYRCKKGLAKNSALTKPRIAAAGIQWWLFKTGLAATSASQVGGFFRSCSAAQYPDIQFHFWPYYLDGWSPPPDQDGYCFDVGPVRSDSRGWVKLRSADPFAKPLIQLNGLSCDADFQRFRQAIGIAREIAAQSAFEYLQGKEDSPGVHVTGEAQLNEYVRNHANSAYHPCGTARMGQDEMAVVDEQGKVHGMERLRVADASIIPTITNGNINAPCIMIGEKIADSIIKSQSAG